MGNQPDADASEAADILDPIERALVAEHERAWKVELRKPEAARNWMDVARLGQALKAHCASRAAAVDIDAARRRRR